MKRVFLLFLSVFVISLSVRAENAVTGGPVSENKHGLVVDGVIPSFSFEDKAFEDAINAAVSKEYRIALAQASSRQGKITFSYETYYYDKYVFVLLYVTSTVGSGTEIVRSFNYDSEKGEFITITSILGPNGLKILNKALQKEVKSNIDKYNANVAEVLDDHTFYVDDGTFYAVFDKYEIAYGSVGVVRLPLDLSKIIEVTVDNYYVKTGFNTKMVRLKDAADAFGMTLEWIEKAAAVSVYAPNGDFLAQITIGKTAYTRGKIIETMEAAPEIKDDRTQVPVSFLGDALNISYTSAGKDKSVIVLTYYAE